MWADSVDTPTLLDLAIRGLKEEHAACVARIGSIAPHPDTVTEVQAYLTRIENINQALIRLAGSRMAEFTH